MGHPVPKDTLTERLGRHNEPFWRDVAEHCAIKTNGYGKLLFDHPKFDDAEIDPSKSHEIRHTWNKWRDIYLNVLSEYKKADANFHQSGTHDSVFENFISKRYDVLYLRMHLNNKPHLTEAVTEKLREGVYQDSEDFNENDKKNSTNYKRRASPTAMLVGAINQFSEMGNKIQEQRVKLMEEEVTILKKRETVEAEQLEISKQTLLLNIEKQKGENQKMKDEHDRHVNDEYAKLTQRIISLRTQLERETM
ncbi:MAG: hypothetical protein MUC38_10175, partial [Cyclobacteriaceae bacterium]|nr:hypothetical protein [Cyclobacteriaceae bacterium]